MLRTKIFGAILGIVSVLQVSSQTYGNEWIDYSKQYYRLKIVEDGLYRVTASELSSAGVPVSTIAVNRYQIFRNGEEIAITTNDSDSDGRLDYLEFYGEKNDGTSDTELYISEDAQPHTYYNLFTDTATYFLTWYLTNTTGNRMAFSSLKDATDLTAQSTHIATNLTLQTSSYNSGLKYGSDFDLQNPKYEYGEGWTGSGVSKGSSQTFTLSLDNYDDSGDAPQLEMVLVGVSNYEHVVEITVGQTSASLSEVGESSFEQRTFDVFESDLDWSYVSSGGQLVIQATVVGVTGVSDRIAISSVRVDYPQTLDLSETAKLYHFEDLSDSRGYVSIPTTDASNLSVYDVTYPESPATVATTSYSDRLEFVYQDSSTIDREFYVTSTYLTVSSITEADMDEISVDGENYIIISHPDLDEETSGSAPVSAYVTYRQSATGGSYDVLYADIDQVYDQFGYGQPTPAAVRNLAFYVAANSDPEYMFLIGKGLTLDYEMYRSTPSVEYYIPTFGYPGSDLLFTVEDGDQSTPLFPVGRLNAVSSSEVQAYLDKVKEMEALDYDELWRKDQLNLSGGQTTAELSTFESYITNFKSVAEGDYLGAEVENVYKNSTETVKTINVADEINEGVNLVTFFGHSSSSLTDIEIGHVSESSNGYSNQGKYPVFLVNGCNAGEIFGTTVTVGEDWMLTSDLGAIGYIANSDYAFSSNLKRYSDLFYQYAFANEETFASSVGEIIHQVSLDFLDYYDYDEEAQSQVYQTVFQGDPAIKVFGAESPDYEILADEVYTSVYSGDRVLASTDSFEINLIIRNYGRTVTDSLDIAIQRTLSDGTQLDYTKTFNRVLRLDTISFNIENDPLNTNQGDNVFVIRLDPDDSVAELNENNNSAVFELFIPKGNTIPLFPIEFATVDSREVDLVWQSASQLELDRIYSLEVDTTAQYNSGFLKQEQLSGDLVLSYSLDLSNMPDSTSVYWRTRFQEAEDEEDTSWVETSFSIVDDQPTGWGQIGDEQFEDDDFSGVDYNTITGAMTFLETDADLQVNTHGINSSGSYSDYKLYVDDVEYVYTESPSDPVCKTNSIGVMIFDKESSAPYRPFGITSPDYSNDLVCGRFPQMIYNFSQSEVNTYLDSLINEMELSDMILLFSFDSMAYSQWDQDVVDALTEVGVNSTTIASLTDGQPVIFLGRKGDSEGSAVEVVSDGSSISVKAQDISLDDEVTGKYTSGSVTSSKIGPAMSWGGFHYDVSESANDTWSFTVTGITSSGDESSLFSGSRSNSTDLSSVNASLYPYMRLAFSFEDEDTQTPPMLKAWSVDYEYPPEGVLTAEDFDASDLAEGESYTKTYLYTNISDVEYSDSLNVTMTVTNVSSGDSDVTEWKIEAPEPGDTTTFDTEVATTDLVGSNNVTMKVVPDGLEQYLTNNSLNLASAFEVTADDTSPVLDVTFDGGYIMDGDIVSPSPTILIRFQDENEYLYKDDTTGINIKLKEPCDECVYERVSFTSSKISYVPASESSNFEITYTPGPLDDGVYELQVNGEDESGNESGVYEISFEVINESTITHFYPYPNPFSTSARFVFTLTGSEIPDQIKIQIMTVTGRVVREITQDEIGSLRIGNNITDYAWDGRDEYGDLLANGVYLYKVFIRQNGQTLKRRSTSADRAFKHGFGKMYILR